MKISQISSYTSGTNFKGTTVSNGTEEDLRRSKFWHANSSVEKTLGDYNVKAQYKAYFASPMESVSDAIKERVDYVVYDNEPAYPDVNTDVSKNYFGEQRKNYRKDFEEIRDYYYRREMGGFANKEEAQYQQWQAAECIRLYDKAGDLRFKKETAEDEIKSIQEEKSAIAKGVQNTKSEYMQQAALKEQIEKHIANLEKLKEPYEQLNNIAQKTIKNEQEMFDNAAKKVDTAEESARYLEGLKNTAYYYEGQSSVSKTAKDYAIYNNNIEGYKDVSSQKGYTISTGRKVMQNEYKKLQESITEFKSIQAKCQSKMSEMGGYIKSLELKWTNLSGTEAAKKSFVEECKKNLIPLFDELKNFYAKQGIKVIKKG